MVVVTNKEIDLLGQLQCVSSRSFRTRWELRKSLMASLGTCTTPTDLFAQPCKPGNLWLRGTPLVLVVAFPGKPPPVVDQASGVALGSSCDDVVVAFSFGP